jgi:predicted nucleotidyltransferase
MFGLTVSDLQCITDVIRKHPEVEQALIFGSRAMGNFKPGSDIDIVLQGGLDENTALDISAELNEQTPLPYTFDVLAYSYITHLPLREHIDQYGQVFYQISPS